MTRFHWLVMALATALAVGCSDNPPTSVPPGPPPPPPGPPGSGVVTLVTPNTDDGALSVTLHGPAIANLQTASSGYVFYSRLVSDSVARIIVIGNVNAGPLFTFTMANGSATSAYHATIEQIATRSNALRASLNNYSLAITAAP